MTAPNTTTNESQQPPAPSTEGNGSGEPPTQPTPPTNPPAPTPIREGVDDYTRALQDQLRIVSQQNLDYQRRLDAAPPTPTNTQPQITNDEFRQNFYNDPKKVFDDFGNRLLSDIKETIKPFESFIREGRSASAYENAKSKLRNDPRFAAHWDVNVDTSLDFLVRSAMQTGQQVTDANIFNMVTAIIGQKAVGALPQFMAQYGLPYQFTQPSNSNPNPPAPNNEPVNNQQLPPNLPPRPPAPAPSSGRQRAKREPNENERRIMRENNFTTVDEYDYWLQVPANQVATAKYPGEGKW